MKVELIDTPGAGTWARDCELICLSDCALPPSSGFKISYRREEDDTFWSLQCELIVAYKVTAEEFSRNGYLRKLPFEGAFFEILDSPWIEEFGPEPSRILDKCKHYVLKFYDETVEIIAQKFIFEQLKEKPEKKLF
jgi:hypothetical protein